MKVEQGLSLLGQSVLQTLLYFDIFRYPLTAREIHSFLGKDVPAKELLDQETEILLRKGLIFQFGSFFSVQNDAEIVTRRIKGNREAEKFIPMAKEKAELIGRFPFIRGIMASGSLSKGYMDEKSDLDFFVVTDPGRLWIARTLFVLYRKAFVPRHRHKEFCANYFVASDHLEIEEKNIFTATELATLIPLVDEEMYQRVISSNPWIWDYLPNFRTSKDFALPKPRLNRFKILLEKLLSVFWADQMNQLLMRITHRRFKQKYAGEFVNGDFSLAFKTRPHVSKAHRGNNQKKVLTLLQNRINEFNARFAHA